MGRIKNFFSYKPLYGENPFSFYFNRAINTMKRDLYEKNTSKASTVHVGNELAICDFYRILEKNTMDCVTDKDVDGEHTFTHINSIQHSKLSHNLLGTKTFCKGLYYRYKESGYEHYLELFKNGVEYLLSKRNDTGLFRYEQPLGLSQDEGPVSAGAIQVLCEAYELLGNELYLNAAKLTANAAKKYLYQEEYGYLHTRGCLMNTTNINSSFAEAFAYLYKLCEQDEWKNEALNCVQRIQLNQKKDGLFIYSNSKPSVFVSLYHYMIPISLSFVNTIIHIDDYDRIVKLAVDYGDTLIKEKGFIFEPDSTIDETYLRCGTRAALMYELLGYRSLAETIIKSFGYYVNGSQVFSTINHNNMSLSDGKYWYRRERHLADAFCDIAQILYYKKRGQ